MEDMRYQVDLLTAMNQKLKNTGRMYKLICDTSQRAFIYINLVNNTVETLGKWENFFDFNLNEAIDLPRVCDYFTEDSQGELRRLLFIEKEGKKHQSLDLRSKDEHNRSDCIRV